MNSMKTNKVFMTDKVFESRQNTVFDADRMTIHTFSNSSVPGP